MYQILKKSPRIIEVRVVSAGRLNFRTKIAHDVNFRALIVLSSRSAHKLNSSSLLPLSVFSFFIP